MSQCQPSNQEKFWREKYPRIKSYPSSRVSVDLQKVEKRMELHRRRVEKFSKIDK